MQILKDRFDIIYHCADTKMLNSLRNNVSKRGDILQKINNKRIVNGLQDCVRSESTIIGGWHATRHFTVGNTLTLMRALKLPHVRYQHPRAKHKYVGPQHIDEGMPKYVAIS